MGDKVLAANPETGEQAAKEVTAVWVHQDQLVDLEVDGAVVTTTEDHPFWNATDQRYEEAQHLDQGDMLLGSDGTMHPAQGINWMTRRTDPAYNLSVADLHTYYVVAGGGFGQAGPKTVGPAVLVHNCDIGKSLARHIGDRQLDGVAEGGVAEYIERVIHDPTLVTQFKKSPSTPESGRSIYRHGKNLIIIDPGSKDGGTAFAKATEEAAMEYFDEFD